MKTKTTSQAPKGLSYPVAGTSSRNLTNTGAGARPIGGKVASTLGATPVVKGAFPITSSAPRSAQKIRG